MAAGRWRLRRSDARCRGRGQAQTQTPLWPGWHPTFYGGQCIHLASWESSGLGSLPRAKVTPHTLEWDREAGRGGAGAVCWRLEVPALGSQSTEPSVDRGQGCPHTDPGPGTRGRWPQGEWVGAPPGGVGGCPPPQQTGMCLLLCPGVWSECPTQSRLCAEQAECSRAGMGSAQGRSVHITSTQRATRAAVHPCCRKPGTAGRGLGAEYRLDVEFEREEPRCLQGFDMSMWEKR